MAVYKSVVIGLLILVLLGGVAIILYALAGGDLTEKLNLSIMTKTSIFG